MTKIILLNPPLSLEKQYKKLASAGSELPPLGIGILASIARQHNQEVKIIDALAMGLDEEETIESILREKPDLLGITVTSLAIFSAAKIAEIIKKHSPSVNTVIGGAHITSLPVETMQRFSSFDIGVIGEGEETFVELFNRPIDLSGIKGIIYRQNGRLITNEKRGFIKNLDSLPYPAWDLFPDLIKYYQPAADSLHRFPSTLLITSRGCPGKCIFCDRSIFGNAIRSYSADYCIGMMEHLVKQYKIKDIFIEDDNFLAFRKRTIEICNKLIEKKLDLTFSIMGRVDMVNPEILKLLKKAGCWQINFGLESGSQKILDIICKGITIEQAKQAMRWTNEAGLKIKGLFMLGNPGETQDTIEQTIKFIKEIPVDDFHMTFFTPFPGSDVANIAPKYGYFNPAWDQINMFSPDKFIPNGLTKVQLLKAYKKIYSAFYFRPRIMFYYFTKLRHPSMIKKIFKGFVAFLKFLTTESK